MYVNGKKVYKVDFTYDAYGELIRTASDCEICDDNPTFRMKVCYDDGEFWDDCEEVDICSDCLIIDGFFFDEDDLFDATH